MRSIKLLSIVLSVCLLAACHKTVETTAVIHVLNADGAPLENAEVAVFASSSSPKLIRDGLRMHEQMGTTNSRGKVVFNFTDLYKDGSAGFAVLMVEAELTITDANNTAVVYTGDGVIKVEEEKENEASITVFP